MRLHHYIDGADHRNQREDEKENDVHLLRRPGNQETGHQQVEHGYREQELPRKAHQLVVTEARKRRANPHEQEEDRAGLGQKPEPFYLKAGDVVELGIDGLGTSKQKAVDYKKI